MNQNGLNQLKLNLSGLGCWIGLFALIWLLGSVGLGWLVKSVAVLGLLLVLAPIVAFIGLRWWLGRNLVQGNCPNCQAPVAGFKERPTLCTNCGTPLQVTAQGFQYASAEGTIDVDAEAVDVEAVEVEVMDSTPRLDQSTRLDQES